MSLNIQEILDSLEADQTPEEALANGLAEDTEKTASAQETPQENTDEQVKLAEELDAQGRIIARSFMDELHKIAVADAPMTINTAAEGNNPSVEVSRGDINEEQIAKVVQILQSLHAPTNAGTGEIAGRGTNYTVEQKTPVDEHPLVADQAAAQRAAAAGGQVAPGMVNSERGKYSQAEVLTTLYNRFFSEEG